jgi:nicotinamide-nucleotide adenylyltransferase
MSPSSIWQMRYDMAGIRLMNFAHVLAVRDTIAGAASQVGQPVTWIGEPLRVSSGARVGVLTGSFNPLTPAHTRLMRSAARALRLTDTIWACSRTTVDKEQVERATLVDRLVQVRAYLDARKVTAGLAVLEAGLYADQATALRSILPPGARVWLIAGFDKVVQILDARYYADRDAALRQLFQTADLAVAPRGQRDGTDLRNMLALPENRPVARHVRRLPAHPETGYLSSTAARALVAGGTTLAELAPYVEPEGAALALVTRAYGPNTALPGGEVIDHYELRQALVAHVARRRKPPRRDAVQRVLDRAYAPTPAGARLRHMLLRAPGSHRP